MVRKLAFIPAVACVILCCCDSTRSADFSAWLGPQDVETGVDHGKLRCYDVDVTVVDGRRLSLENSTNPVLTSVGGKIVRADGGAPVAGRLYVVGKVRLRTAKGWRVYDCAVRVRSGPLEGAIIRICVAEFAPAPRIGGVYQAYYELPDGLHASEGPVDYEVILFNGK